MAETVELKQNFGGKSSFHALKRLLAHISFRYHISPRLKIYVNSIIVAFPAFVQYLFFDEMEFLVSFVLCFGLVASLFLLSRARLILTLPFVLLSFIYTVFLVMYSKSLGITSIMALFNTKLEAMIGFLASPMMITASLAFLLVFSLYFRFIIMKGADDDKEQLIPKGKKYIPATVIVFTLVFFYFQSSYLYRVYPFSLFYDSGSYARIVSEMKRTSERKIVFSGQLDHGFREKSGTMMLIVGESSRRASWSLYGYKRKTNVFLKTMMDEHSENFLLFKDYHATGQTTYPNLMSIFSMLPSKEFSEMPKSPSFVRVLGNVAYRTWFISTYENIFMNFIGADENKIVKGSKDADLLPVIEDSLDNTKYRKKFIVVHLRGSHFAFSDYSFTFNDYISPSDNPIRDKYDNSLIHTDLFLKDVMEQALKNPEPVFIWYVSDHGENLNDFGDGNFGHGCAGFTVYELELPSVIFMNNAFLEKYPQVRNLRKNSMKTVSHSNISHTFFGLGGIYPREYRKTYDLSSDGYRYEEPYVIDCDLFSIRYSKAIIQD